MKEVFDKLKVVYYFIYYRYLNNSNREKIEKRQSRKLKKLLKFIKKESSFYKNISEIPIIDKTIMMSNFDVMNTVDINKEEAFELAIKAEKERMFSNKLKGITIGLSSGTSGNRGLFIASDQERNKWAGAILAKTLPKNKIFNNRVAFFLRADSNLYQTVNSKILKFEYFDIYKDMDENIKKLGEFKPTILVAPPSVLFDIAKAVLNKKILINPVKVISVAEVLEKRDAEYFKKVFNQNVIHQVYQCTEGFLGYTCDYGVLHMNEDIVKIEKEYIDDRRFIPVITDVERTSQPIIKYRLNDILVEKKEPCRCGLKLQAIEQIEGRTDDIFIFEGIKNEEVKVFSDFIRRCILFVPDVQNYKVVQISKKNIDVHLDQMNIEIKNEIVQEFEKLAVDLEFKMPEINFEPYEQDYSKKLKRVERKFNKGEYI